jgi:hypothetical protein
MPFPFLANALPSSLHQYFILTWHGNGMGGVYDAYLLEEKKPQQA